MGEPKSSSMGAFFAALMTACTPDAVEEPTAGVGLRDQALERGLDFNSLAPPAGSQAWELACCGGGSALADFDNDGDLDVLLLARWGETKVFENDGSGTFNVAESNLPIQLQGPRAAAAGDLDGDGLVDLVIGQVNGVAFFRNAGNFEFEALGVALSDAAPDFVASVALTDLGGDNRLDVLVAMHRYVELEGQVRRWGGLDRILTVDLTQSPPVLDRSALLGEWAHREAMTLVMGADDLDADGVLDLLLIRDHGEQFEPNVFLRGQKDGAFIDASADYGLDLAMDGMGLAVGDWNKDDSPDLVITDLGKSVPLLSLQNGRAIDVTEAWGLDIPRGDAYLTGWGVEAIDLEHDGDLDLVAAFGRASSDTEEGPQGIAAWTWGDGRFHDSTARVESEPQLTQRSLLRGDVDGDGFEDVLVSAWIGSPRLLINEPGPEAGGTVQVSLVGPSTNRSGLGALVEARRRGVHETQRRRIGSATTSFGGSSSPIATFGLGDDTQADYIAVRWPDGRMSVFSDVQDGAHIVARWDQATLP